MVHNSKSERSDRRNFVRKLLGFGAATGVAGIFGGKLEGNSNLVSAQSSGSALLINAINDGGTGTTQLNSSTTDLSGAATLFVQNDGVNVNAIGVEGLATSTSGWSTGVYGEGHSADGEAVDGTNLAGSGDSTGVGGFVRSPDGTGVLGYARPPLSGWPLLSGAGVGVLGISYWPDGTGTDGISQTMSGFGTGVYGRAKSPDGTGVFGQASLSGGGGNFAASGYGTGVEGDSWFADGTGVVGVNQVASGYATGVYGRVKSPDGTAIFGQSALSGQPTSVSGYGTGVQGNSWFADGTGIVGVNQAESGYTTGVYGRVKSADGTAIIGSAALSGESSFEASGAGVGVQGTSWFADGWGVNGMNRATSGNTTGVRGRVASPNGFAKGVEGIAFADDFVAASGSSMGVYGESLYDSGIGVYGVNSSTSGHGVGVLGTSYYSPNVVSIVAQAAPGQVSNLQEWQDANGNPLSAVNASGSLGIHASPASYALDLRTPGSSSAQMHISSANADSGGYLTSANPGNLFMSAGAAWNGSAWVAKNNSAYQYGGGTAGVRFFFDTGLTAGSTYTPTTRIFIGPTGHVGIGMSTQPGHLLQLGLDDAAKPSTNTWTIASDERLKDPDSIRPFTEGSEFIKRLPQPVWFKYRNDSGLPNDRSVAGWIAQDIAPVAPFMVRRTRQRLSVNDAEETETLSLNTNELSYAVVNTLKELLDKLHTIEQQNRSLREQLGSMQTVSRRVQRLDKRQTQLEEQNRRLRNDLEHLKNTNKNRY